MSDATDRADEQYIPQPWRFNTDGSGFYDDYVAKSWAMLQSDNLCGYSDEDYDVQLGEFRADLKAHDDDLTATLAAEVKRLEAWKAEALPVMSGLQELGEALGLPLGSRITGPEAVERAKRLASEVADHADEVAAMANWQTRARRVINAANGVLDSADPSTEIPIGLALALGDLLGALRGNDFREATND